MPPAAAEPAESTVPAQGAEPLAAGPPQAPPAPPFPPWGIAGSLGVVAAFALTQLLVALAFGALWRWWGSGLPDAGPVPPLMHIALPVSLFSSHLVGWLGTILLVVRRHGMGLVEGLRLARHPWPSTLRALLAGMGLQVLAAVLVVFFPPPPDFISPIERLVRMGPWAVGTLFVVAVLLAPALEEAMFRGLLLPALRRRYAFAPSALVVTVLFTALHATQTGSYLPPLAGIALCGWFLARWRERTGSLWPPMAFHAGFNLTAFLPLVFLTEQW